MAEYVVTDGEGKQTVISKLTHKQLKKQLMKITAKFKREGRRLNAVCSELNRRNKKRLKDGKIKEVKHVFKPNTYLNRALGQMFSIPFVVNDNHMKLEAIFSLALKLLENDSFNVEDDLPIVVQILKQGRANIDD